MDERLHIKRGNGDGADWRMSVVEQQLDELRPRVTRNEEVMNNLITRFDELVPRLTIAVDNLTIAVAQWNIQRSLVTKLAGWGIGLFASIGVTVIAAVVAAKLIGLL